MGSTPGRTAKATSRSGCRTVDATSMSGHGAFERGALMGGHHRVAAAIKRSGSRSAVTAISV